MAPVAIVCTCSPGALLDPRVVLQKTLKWTDSPCPGS